MNFWAEQEKIEFGMPGLNFELIKKRYAKMHFGTPGEIPGKKLEIIFSEPYNQAKEQLDKTMNENKVTKEGMAKKIVHVNYQKLSPKHTHCILTLENGFEVTGESACVDPANYDAAIGQKIAYDNAFEKLWPLEGYLLQEKLFQEKKHYLSETNECEARGMKDIAAERREYANKNWPKFPAEKYLPKEAPYEKMLREAHEKGDRKRVRELEDLYNGIGKIESGQKIASEHFHKQYPITPDEAFKIESDFRESIKHNPHIQNKNPFGGGTMWEKSNDFQDFQD
jgi:hypothetical protein